MFKNFYGKQVGRGSLGSVLTLSTQAPNKKCEYVTLAALSKNMDKNVNKKCENVTLAALSK